MPPPTAQPLAAINPSAARPRNGNVWFSSSILRPSQFAAASLSISPLRTLRAISLKQVFQTGFFSARITFFTTFCFTFCLSTWTLLHSEYTTALAQTPNPKLIGVLTSSASYAGLCGNDCGTLAHQAFAGVIIHCPPSFSWS